MSPADRLAVRVKSQPLLKEAIGIVIGSENFDILKNNPDPCEPPDLQYAHGETCFRFCGLPVINIDYKDKTALAILVPVP